MPRPTYESVERKRQSLTKLWQPAWENWRIWERLINQEHTIEFVKPAKVRKLGLAKAKIQAMVDTLVTNSPKVTRKAVNKSEEAKQLADKVEKWGTGALRKAAAQQFLTPPFRTAATFMASLGYGAGVVRWDDDAWPKDEEAKKRAFPFILEFPHPGRVLIPSNERQPSLVIEIATMFNWQVAKMLGKSEEEAQGEPFDIIEVITYWDEEWKGVFAGSEDIKVTKNGLGFIPWTHGFAGYGMERMPTSLSMAGTGATSPNVYDMGPTPVNLARGLLSGVEDSIIYLDEHITARRWLEMEAAYGRRVLGAGEDAEEVAQQISEGGLGAVLSVNDVNQLRREDIPNIGAWMDGGAAQALADIERGTTPAVISGERAPRQVTATGEAMTLAQARMKFEMPMQQLNYFAAQQLAFCARMVVARGESVTIDDVTCSEDDFQDYFDFEVDFLAKDEGSLLRAKADAREEIKMALLDFKGYQDTAGRGDATGLQRRIFVDKALTSEQVMGPIIQAAVAAFTQKVAGGGVTVTPPVPAGGSPPGAGEAQTPFTPQAGGPVEAEQVEQGMMGATVTGQDMGRTIPK